MAEENRHVKKRTKKAPRKEEADDDFFDSLVAADALPKFVELLKFKVSVSVYVEREGL